MLQIDAAAAEKMPGVVKVVRDGNFLAVVARGEFQAIKAMRVLAAAARWTESERLPHQGSLQETLLGLPSQDSVIHERRDDVASSTPLGTPLEATYTRPYIAHGSIGPSCAVAQFSNGSMTVWTHTQGVYPDRQAIAEMLALPWEKVRCIHMEGSGCYGHNGADDAAADAALIAMTLPDRPVRVQWMREQEHAWEPFGPAMIAKVRGSVDRSGRIDDWDYGVWSNTHSMRPGPAGALLAAQHMARAYPAPQPKPLPLPEGGGDRNAIPLYELRNARWCIISCPTCRSGFRRCALSARISMCSPSNRSWTSWPRRGQRSGRIPAAAPARPAGPGGRECSGRPISAGRLARASRQVAGRGSRLRNTRIWPRIARWRCKLHVDTQTGRTEVLRAVAAVDTGQIVNPDGVRNQIEGGIVQAVSWTLFEQVSFDAARISSVDWSTYPIMRFASVPQAIEVHLIDRAGLPMLGCGEAAQGPAAAALANAIAAATGRRIRDLPLSAKRIRTLLNS